MAIVFEKTKGLTDAVTHYCPGCTHGIVHRLVGESLEELAANLFYLLRDFDRTMPDVILAEGVSESGIGLAVMNRMRKAAGYQIVNIIDGKLLLKNGELPLFMVK